MIPTLILLGLVFGHWWRVAIPAAAVSWVAILIATGVDDGVGFAFGAAALAVANVAVGVLIHQALWLAVRGLGVVGRKAAR